MAKVINIFNSVVTAFLLAAPVSAQTAQLDRLFEELSEAPPEAVDRIEGQIQTAWDRSGSAAMDLLLRRGKEALEEGEPQVAVEHFTALIDHAPEFAEGYNGRATAFYLTGAVGPALADLQVALQLNPRHFGALRGLGIILEELERPDDALEVYEAVLALNPQSQSVQDAVARLQVALEGQSL